MTAREQIRAWLLALLVLVALLWLLNDILLPFVAGIAVAYFLDPLVDRLERRGMKRDWGAVLVLSLFFMALVFLALLIVPVLHSQIVGLTERMPTAVAGFRDSVLPLVQDIITRFNIDVDGARSALQEVARDAANFIIGVLKRALSGGLAVFNLLSLLLITPIVAYYMLRDFDLMTAKVHSLLPRQHEASISKLLSDIDRVLDSFVRGQSTVCLILGTFYAVSLSLIGLDFGLIIGLISGLVSFVPFVGVAVGLILSMLTALTQFLPEADYLRIGLVAVIFVTGQIAEGNFLTPRLLGDRVGLHPVWVMFALLAGGALAGFVGVLIAVPVAAATGVMVRHGINQYVDSRLYRGAENDSGSKGG